MHAEHLRGGRAPQIRARHRLEDHAALVRTLDRVGDGHGEDAARDTAVGEHLVDEAGGLARLQAGSRRIMHEHPRVPVEPCVEKAVDDRLRTLPAAAAQHPDVFRKVTRHVVDVGIRRAHDHDDLAHALDGSKGAHRMHEHRLRAEFHVLLGRSEPHAAADAGRAHEPDHLRGFTHPFLLLVPWPPQARQALMGTLYRGLATKRFPAGRAL